MTAGQTFSMQLHTVHIPMYSVVFFPQTVVDLFRALCICLFSGNIRTTEVLDRETQSYYWLTIFAQDRGTIPLSSMVEVLIEVEDINDNVPQTIEPVYYSGVMENSPEGTSVVKLQAIDLDDSRNNRLTYEINSGNPQGFFQIDHATGQLCF